MEFKLMGIENDSEVPEIERCLRNLYTTPAGSMPCDRDFGLSWASLDAIPEEMQAIYTLELMEKTDKYEPRIKVMEVEFSTTKDGGIGVSITVEKGSEINV